jgi:hypothetical protein
MVVWESASCGSQRDIFRLGGGAAARLYTPPPSLGEANLGEGVTRTFLPPRDCVRRMCANALRFPLSSASHLMFFFFCGQSQQKKTHPRRLIGNPHHQRATFATLKKLGRRRRGRGELQERGSFFTLGRLMNPTQWHNQKFISAASFFFFFFFQCIHFFLRLQITPLNIAQHNHTNVQTKKT